MIVHAHCRMDIASRIGGRRAALPASWTAILLVMVAASKASVSYLAATTSMSHTTATTFTLIALAVASICALVMHKPWQSSGRIAERDVMRLLTISFIMGLCTCGSVYALRAVEPLRASLLEVSDIALVGGLTYALGRTSKSTVLRGVIMAVVGAVLLVWYDPAVAATRHLNELALPLSVGAIDSGVLGEGSGAVTVLPHAAVTSRQGVPAVAPAGSASVGADLASTAPKRKRAQPRPVTPVDPLPASKRATGEEDAEIGRKPPQAVPVGEAEGEAEGAGSPDEDGAAQTGTRAEEGEDVGPDDGYDVNISLEDEDEGTESGNEGEGEEKAQQRSRQRMLLQQDRTAVKGIHAADTEVAAPLKPVTVRQKARKYAEAAARGVVSQTSKIRAVINKHERSSVVLAAVLLTAVAWLDSVRRQKEMQLSMDTGVSRKKLHATVLTTAALLWSPIAALRWMTIGSAADAEAVADVARAAGQLAKTVAAWHSGPSSLLLLMVAGLYGIVVLIIWEYSTEVQLIGVAALGGTGHSSRGSAQRADVAATRLLSCAAAFSTSLILAQLYGWTYQLTLPLVLGAALYLPGLAASADVDGAHVNRLIAALTRGGPLGLEGGRRSGPSSGWGILSELFGSDRAHAHPHEHSDEGGVTKGYTGSGQYGSSQPSVLSLSTLRKVMKHIWEDNNSRKILMFLVINFAFMFVEITVGWLTNSLGLISDAGHMFFDNASLFIGLYASYMARWKRDDTYTYGYARYEVLAGFVNAVFLVFVAVSVVMEALERLSEPPEIRGEHLLTVSCMGLGVNIIGLVFFHEHSEGGGHGGHGHSHGGHSHGGGTNENMQGVYLHVLADAMGSVGVIISSLLIQWYGWHLADPVASICISVLILMSVAPLIGATVGPLLSRVPQEMEGSLVEAVANTRRIAGVTSVHALHFWKHHADVIVGTLHVGVGSDADPQRVLRVVRTIFSAAGVHDLTCQVDLDDGSLCSGQGASEGPGAHAIPAFGVTVADTGCNGLDEHYGHSHGSAPEEEEHREHGHSHGGGGGHGHSKQCNHGHSHG